MTPSHGSWRSPAQPVPNVALDSAVIRPVSGSEQMVTPSGPFPAGSPAAAARAASENGFYVDCAPFSPSFHLAR